MSWLDEPGVAEDDRPVAALVHDVVVGPEPSGPWRIARVRLGGVADKATLIAALRRGLGGPDHMGTNWDAVADVLGDRGDALAIILDGDVESSCERDLGVLLEIVDEQTRIERPPTRAVRVRRRG